MNKLAVAVFVYWATFFRFGNSVLHDKQLQAEEASEPKSAAISATCGDERNRRQSAEDKEFVRAGKVEELFIYPIKSGKANKVNLKAVIQRGDIRRARLFEDLQTDGFDCGDEVAKALDEFLLEGTDNTRKLRLIYFGDEWLYTERNPKPEKRWWVNNELPEVNDKIAYADLAGYMAFSAASVDDINSHLSHQDMQVDARYFRPNLVIGELPAFDEDKWLYVRAGEAEFACYKPCTRCVMTTIDPETGLKNERMEPLKELRKYRLAPGKLLEVFKEKPIFGVNMAIVRPGRVRVGDPVWIKYKPTPY